MRGVRALGAAIAAVVFVAAAASPAYADDASQFVDKTNALRASKGVGTLAVNSDLVNIAQRWAAHMAATQTLQHNPNLASELPSNWIKYGENIGYGGDVDSIHQAFVNSPHHYANLVDPAFQYIGVAVVIDSKNILWVVEDFMETSSGQPSAPPPTHTPVTRSPQPAPRVTSPPSSAAPTAAPTTATSAAPSTTAAPTLPQIVGELKHLKADS